LSLLAATASAAPQYGQGVAPIQPPAISAGDWASLNPYGSGASEEIQQQWNKFLPYLTWLVGPAGPPGPPGPPGSAGASGGSYGGGSSYAPAPVVIKK